MFNQIYVEVRNAGQVENSIDQFSEETRNAIKLRFLKLLTNVRASVAEYPPPYAGEPPHEWASERQRRYVMWAIRHGEITVPYQRTYTYKHGWNIERKVEQDGDSMRLYTEVPYARYVTGDTRGGEAAQNPIHRTRWMPLVTSLQLELESLPDELQQDVAVSARRSGF
jgi:hypothetical protein